MPKPSRERHQARERRAAHRALARDRRAQVEPRERADRPAREPDRQSEPAALLARERGDREVAAARLDRLGERRQTAGGGAEVAVAEDEHAFAGARLRQRPPRRDGHRMRPCRRASPARSELRARLGRELRRVVRGAAVDDEHPASPGRRRARRAPSRRSGRPRLCAVTITTRPGGSGDTAGYSAANLAQGASSPTNWRCRLANVEAHITGTVWKIEVAAATPWTKGTPS